MSTERDHGDSGDGYRRTPRGGPGVRTDIIDVYVFQRVGGSASAREVRVLQMLRATEPLAGTWHPIMGHVEPGETAVDAAVREAAEEVGLEIDGPMCLGMYALEQTYPFYVAELDCIVLSPRFAVEVSSAWEPRLNGEHSAARWIGAPYHGGQPAGDFFLWPGQRMCIADLVRDIVPVDSITRERLRVKGRGSGLARGG
jgi:dATP pyrophosphohydrolase